MNRAVQDWRAQIEDARTGWRLRWMRRRLLLRAIRGVRSLVLVRDRTAAITPGTILLAAAFRNEALRLPYFLQHYRRLGVGHFLIVDNGSTDATAALLDDQQDVSLWSARGAYRDARFGLDWINGLLFRHAHGHWTLTVDADELLVYPYWETRDLRALTGWLDRCDMPAFGAMMLDLYPKGPLASAQYAAGDDPRDVLRWFDSGNYGHRFQPRLRNLWTQGGVRSRVFFADQPQRSPTLNKLPLVKWNRRYAYLNSTHTILPRRLDTRSAQDGQQVTSGLLLHTKFLPNIAEKSREELVRGQHFIDPDSARAYHGALTTAPDLWCAASTRLQGWRHLEALGLMARGGWI